MIERKYSGRLLLFIPVLLSIVLSSFSPDKELEVMIRPDGAVVFVKPRTMKRENRLSGKMEYDWTLNTLCDSAYFTCTVRSENILPFDKLSFCMEADTISCVTERVYAEPVGNKWVYRLRCAITQKDFDFLSSRQSAPSVATENLEFRHSKKEWTKRQIVFKAALEIIKQNTK